jgi:hypothetical protein
MHWAWASCAAGKSKIDKQECPPGRGDDLKCPPRCSGHDSRNSIFIFENREDLRIFPIFFFTGEMQLIFTTLLVKTKYSQARRLGCISK